MRFNLLWENSTWEELREMAREKGKDVKFTNITYYPQSSFISSLDEIATDKKVLGSQSVKIYTMLLS